MENTDTQLKAILEAIVYVTDEPLSAQQMGLHAVKKRDLERDSFARQLCTGGFRNFAKSRGHFEHGKMFSAGRFGNALGCLNF